MTCQSCQTWNSDFEHRCRRCGRRLRATPTRHVRESYPIAATALAYQPEDQIREEQAEFGPSGSNADDGLQPAHGQQQVLFSNPVEPRVIPFDLLTSPAERESIHARAAQLSQPAPVRSAKVEVSARSSRRPGAKSDDQQQFDFFGKSEIFTASTSAIQCGAPVATAAVRLNAALVDGFMILLGTFLFLASFRWLTGELPSDRYALAAYGIAAVLVSLAYKLIWCFADKDSFGILSARLRVVDYDGNAPTRRQRFWRALSSLLSLGAAGLGLIWIFADVDGLAWHDQISGTFPTFLEE